MESYIKSNTQELSSSEREERLNDLLERYTTAKTEFANKTVEYNKAKESPAFGDADMIELADDELRKEKGILMQEFSTVPRTFKNNISLLIDIEKLTKELQEIDKELSKM